MNADLIAALVICPLCVLWLIAATVHHVRSHP